MTGTKAFNFRNLAAKNALRSLKIILVTTGAFSSLVSCSSFGPNIYQAPKAGIAKSYKTSIEAAWRATIKAIRLPIVTNDIESGLIETEFVRSNDGFRPPGQKERFPTAHRYKLIIHLVKGKTDGEDAVRVNVKKLVQNQDDFFSEPEELASDGLEEKTIHYRIERQLTIDGLIQKASSTPSK